jgi:hypothetical protein
MSTPFSISYWTATDLAKPTVRITLLGMVPTIYDQSKRVGRVSPSPSVRRLIPQEDHSCPRRTPRAASGQLIPEDGSCTLGDGTKSLLVRGRRIIERV